MKLSWLGTTAVALVIGSGAVIAQSQTDQKREEGPRAQQNQSKDRDAASPADRKDRRAQPEQKGGAKEQQRGESAPPAERKQQAQEPPRDTKEPTRQSQDEQRGRDAKQPADAKQQQGQQGQPKDNQARDAKQPDQKQQQGQQAPSKRDNQARDTKQPDQKQQQGQQSQPKQDNQARDSKQPADTKQQQGQTKQDGQQRGQASQPPTSPTQSTQQGSQPGTTGQNPQQGQTTTGQSSDPSRPGGTSASTTVNDQQRGQIVDRLRRDRSVSRQNINIQVSVGERLPPRARLQRLPPDIVRIAPQYRGHEYTVIEDRVYVVEPRTRRVVDVISESGPGTRTTSTFQSGGSPRIIVSQEQRESFKQVARRGMTSAPTSASPSGSLSDQSCLTLQPVPEELVRSNSELSQYRYLVIGEQIILVDPRQQKVVEVID